MTGTLTAIERERAAQFTREGDRRDYIAAHLLIRHCAAAYLGLSDQEPTLVQHCDQHGPGSHGRPSIVEAPELGVSLSHTAGYVAVVAGPGRVGIDAEHVPEGPADAALIDFALAPGELALAGGDSLRLIRQWVRKEALVKRGELTLDDFPLTDLSDIFAIADTSDSSGSSGGSDPSRRSDPSDSYGGSDLSRRSDPSAPCDSPDLTRSGLRPSPHGEAGGAVTFGWRGRRLLEWTAGTVVATAITDHPAELRRVDA